MSKNKIVDLIVDAASDKILFKLISKNKTYTNEHQNCRKNFDKFSVLLMNFLTKKQYSFKKIRNVFINQGPGKYTSISCLLYTSDAADDLLCVDLGGRRIIKKFRIVKFKPIIFYSGNVF